jgi:antitoxin (DNA-binding transcriptional repressor) of toxin-antitoxin stability system
MLDIMLNMKKKVTAREFLHGFAKVHSSLKPGESVTITKRGEPLGHFVKESSPKIALPDFEKLAKADGFGTGIGDSLLKKILADEALS